MGGLFVSLLLLAADQTTKYLAQAYLMGSRGIEVIPGVFQLFYLQNRGAAFGMMENRQWFFAVIALVMILAACYVYLRLPMEKHYGLARIVCVLIVSGAAGNMIDRIFHSYVIDFLYFSLIDFPVFNVADCYVCAGAALGVLAIFTLYRDDDFGFLISKKKDSRVLPDSSGRTGENSGEHTDGKHAGGVGR